MSGPRRYWKGACLGGVALVAGCAEVLGPERFETTRVSGVVVEGNRPVGKGWVEFHPFGGTVGVMRSAPLRPDGSFVADGVAVGVNRVGIAGAPVATPGGRRLFHPLGSPILRTVPKVATVPLRIDLAVEAAAHPATPAGR